MKRVKKSARSKCRICKKDHLLTVKDALRLQAHTPGRLAAALRGMAADRIARRPHPATWSVREIVVHLRDCEIVYSVRIRKMIAEKGGALIPFDQDLWAYGLAYRREDTKLALESFAALRRANVALLKTLGAKALDGYGIHPEYGRLRVRDLAVHWAAHDVNHLGQIQAIRKVKLPRR